MGEPRVVFHFLSYFIFVSGIKNQERAAFVDQRAAHQNETVSNELIDKRRVFIPKGLLTRAL